MASHISGQCDVKYIMMLMIKTITSVLKVLTDNENCYYSIFTSGFHGHDLVLVGFVSTCIYVVYEFDLNLCVLDLWFFLVTHLLTPK